MCSIYHNSINTSPNFSGVSFSERAKESLSKQSKTIFDEFDDYFRENRVEDKAIFCTNYSCLKNHKHVRKVAMMKMSDNIANQSIIIFLETPLR